MTTAMGELWPMPAKREKRLLSGGLWPDGADDRFGDIPPVKGRSPDVRFEPISAVPIWRLSLVQLGLTVGEHFATYRDLSYALGLYAQIAFGLFPLIQAHTLRRSRGDP